MPTSKHCEDVGLVRFLPLQSTKRRASPVGLQPATPALNDCERAFTFGTFRAVSSGVQRYYKIYSNRSPIRHSPVSQLLTD